MLVLTRKSEEKIIIGNGKKKIVITVLKIQGDKVSIGIDADRDTPIYRDELLSKGISKNGSVMDASSPSLAVQDIQIEVTQKCNKGILAEEVAVE